MLIIYFILLYHGWEFVAIEDNNSPTYCSFLKYDLEQKFTGKMGNMKVICLEDNGKDL